MTCPFDAGPSRSAAAGVLSIDLAALADNWRLLAQRAAPAECASVVKANAYGIGIEPAAQALHAAGSRTFFVAQIAEGIRVRAALGAIPRIFVLNGLQAGAEPSEYVAHGLSPVIGSPEELARWARQATDGPAPALHIDTGMSRLGFASLAELEQARLCCDRARMKVSLVMSHFVSSEIADDSTNSQQIARFEAARALFPGAAASLANSSGIFLGQRPTYDLVRAGYALYGGNPTPAASNPMRSVVRLEVRIQQVRWIEPGASVGYNAQWTSKRRTRLAALLIGYADGLTRAAGATNGRPGAEVLIAGRRCPLVGRISMDLSVADVTELPEAVPQPGNSAVLLGDEIGIDELGTRSGTNGYHVLTSLGARFRREYVGSFLPAAAAKTP
jgi:alanine racemase